MRFIIIPKADKVAFIQKALDLQLKMHTLAELCVNRYLLLSRIDEVINDRMQTYAKKRFDQYMKKGEIGVKAFDAFPKTITIGQETPQDFNKNYYEKIDKLNKEELSFVERLDLETLPNIEFWIRNREKKDPFYLQGWRKGKFYPDFIAVTKKGAVIALEWKGEDRISNEDTAYKVEIGELWARLGESKLHFFLVHNGNVESVLNDLKTL